MTLIDRILELIQTDDEDSQKLSISLINEYDGSGCYARKKIDACFRHLCGYSLDTLIKEYEKTQPCSE